MARRAAGEGSVYKEQATGRWRVKVRLPDGRVKRMNAKSQQDAVRKLREFRPPRAGGEARVSEYVKEWLNEVQQARVEQGDLRLRSLEWKRQMLDYYVVPAIGRKRLGELRVADVMWMLKGLANEGLARTTIKGVRGVLCQMLDQAMAEERVDKNVARAALMPSGIQPTSHGTLRRINKRICLAAGLGRWTPHEYRHTAGSLLLDAGVSREDVRRVLRHKNMRMLDEVYGHEVRPSVAAAVDPMEAMFGGQP